MERVELLALTACCLLIHVTPSPAQWSNKVETTVGQTIYLPCPSDHLSVQNGSWSWLPDPSNDDLVTIVTFNGSAAWGPDTVGPPRSPRDPLLPERLVMPWETRGVYSLRVAPVQEGDMGTYVCTLTVAGSKHVAFETELIVRAAVPPTCLCPRPCPQVLWLVPLGIVIGLLATVPLLSCLCDTLLNFNRRKKTIRKWYALRLRTLLAVRERSVIPEGNVAEVLVIGPKEPDEAVPQTKETAPDKND